MNAELAGKRNEIAALCRMYRVSRLELFGSAARALDFNPERSDIDFLVTFSPDAPPPALAQVHEFALALERVLGRPVDLVERAAVEASRNHIRRRRILAEAEPFYG